MHIVKANNLNRLWNEIRDEVQRTSDLSLSNGICQGGEITKLAEARLEVVTNSKLHNAVIFHSCTDALTQGLRNLNLPAGSEVLVPAYTFIATATSILLAGLKPVFVDVGNDYCIDLSDAKEKITNNTRVMLYVTLWGNSMNKYAKTFCDENNLLLVEDAAQSLGALLNDAEFTVLSFSPSKPCTTMGSGGALITKNKDVFELARLGRLHGKSNNSTPSIGLGVNSMISSTEAATLYITLGLMKKHQSKRQKIANIYKQELRDLYEFPDYTQDCTYSKFVIKCDKRDELAQHLRSNNIQTQIHYSILPIQEKIFDVNYSDFKNSLTLQEKSLTIPNCPYMTDDEIERVLECLKKF
jgi:dTDP-4-amino-4,6-dideoxygalactose transaminase